MSTVNAVRQSYTGEGGLEYRATVFSPSPWVCEVTARSRALKFQPYVNPDDDVLEYGVGMGFNLRYLRARRRVGFDVNDATRVDCERLGIEFTTDVASLQRQQFSVVICHHTLEHVPDPITVLETIKGLVKAGGRLVLCVPYETGRYFRRYFPNEPNRHLFSWNPLTLGNLATVVGFEIESSSIGPFGYEQRLAFLARPSFALYRLGLWAIRTLHPANEVFLVARKPAAQGNRSPAKS